MADILNETDEYSHINEEFRKLVIPLICKLLDDNPSDVALYCARYFHDIIQQRGKETKIQGAETIADEERQPNLPTQDCQSRLQGSASLPILSGNPYAVPVRETSSWNNPSKSHKSRLRRCDDVVNVTDAICGIGDQPEVKQGQEGEFTKDKNEQRANSERSKKSRSGGDKQNDGNDFASDDKLEVSAGVVQDTMHKTEEYFPSAPPPFCDEGNYSCLGSLINLDSGWSMPESSSNARKKWSKEDCKDELKAMPECRNSKCSDSEDSTNGYEQLVEVENTDSFVKHYKRTSPNQSFGFVPQFREPRNESIINGIEDYSVGSPMRGALSAEEVQSLIKSVSETFLELEKELMAAEVYFNKKLMKVKELSDSVQRGHAPEPKSKKRNKSLSNSEEVKSEEMNFKGDNSEKNHIRHHSRTSEKSQSSESDGENQFLLGHKMAIPSRHPLRENVLSDIAAGLNVKGTEEDLEKARDETLNVLQNYEVNTFNEVAFPPALRTTDIEESRFESGKRKLALHNEEINGCRSFSTNLRRPNMITRKGRPLHFCGPNTRNVLRTSFRSLPPSLSVVRPSLWYPPMSHIGEGGDTNPLNHRQYSVGTDTDIFQISRTLVNLNQDRDGQNRMSISRSDDYVTDSPRCSTEYDFVPSPESVDTSYGALGSSDSWGVDSFRESTDNDIQTTTETDTSTDLDFSRIISSSRNTVDSNTSSPENMNTSAKDFSSCNSIGNNIKENSSKHSDSGVLDSNSVLEPLDSDCCLDQGERQNTTQCLNSDNFAEISADKPCLNSVISYSESVDDNENYNAPTQLVGLEIISNESGYFETMNSSTQYNCLPLAVTSELNPNNSEESMNEPLQHYTTMHAIRNSDMEVTDLEIDYNLVALAEITEDYCNEEDEKTTTNDAVNNIDNLKINLDYHSRAASGSPGKVRKSVSGMTINVPDAANHAEGDRNSSHDCQIQFEGVSIVHSVSKPSSEPGLDSAGGDFAASEADHFVEQNQVPSVSPENEIDNILPPIPPLNVRGISIESVSGTMSSTLDEDSVLNFACLSGSDTSELVSSDMSDEDLNELSVIRSEER